MQRRVARGPRCKDFSLFVGDVEQVMMQLSSAAVFLPAGMTFAPNLALFGGRVKKVIMRLQPCNEDLSCRVTPRRILSCIISSNTITTTVRWYSTKTENQQPTTTTATARQPRLFPQEPSIYTCNLFNEVGASPLPSQMYWEV